MASQHLLEASGVLLVTVTFSLVGHGPDVLLNVDVRTGRIRLIVLVCLTRDSLQFFKSLENRLRQTVNRLADRVAGGSDVGEVELLVDLAELSDFFFHVLFINRLITIMTPAVVVSLVHVLDFAVHALQLLAQGLLLSYEHVDAPGDSFPSVFVNGAVDAHTAVLPLIVQLLCSLHAGLTALLSCLFNHSQILIAIRSVLESFDLWGALDRS
jgi:hypothetical protein